MHSASGALVLSWQVARLPSFQQASAGLRWRTVGLASPLRMHAQLMLLLFPKVEARAGIYVDVLVITLMGTPATRRCVQATFVLVWRALNLQLSCCQGPARDGKLPGSVV